MTTTAHVTADPVGRAVRQIRQHVERATQLPVPSRPVPYRHSVLFREAVYADGQPYADADDLEDEGDSKTGF